MRRSGDGPQPRIVAWDDDGGGARDYAGTGALVVSRAPTKIKPSVGVNTAPFQNPLNAEIAVLLALYANPGLMVQSLR